MKPFAAILAAVAAAWLPTASVAGIYYEVVTETAFERGSAMDGTRMAARAWVEDGNTRLVFADAGNGAASEGTWLVTRDGGRSMTLVNPRQKTYSELDLAGLSDRVGDMFKSLEGQADIDFGQPQMKKISEGPGPELLGYETTHAVYETTYEIRIDMQGSSQSIETRIRREQWTTDEIEAPPGGLWPGAGTMTTGVQGLDAIIGQESALASQGFPLKSVVVTTTTVKGTTSTTRSTTRVTGLEERDIDDAVFDIPSGFSPDETPGLDDLMRLYGQ